MKTDNFFRSLEIVNTFCLTSNQGFIVVEVNDYIMKRELIHDLSKSLKLHVIELDSFGEKNIRTEDINDSVLVVDAISSVDIEKVVVNLNYNRDWLLALNCNIVFLLTSSMVDRLISFSYSFWSFVSLHLKLVDKFYCILEPQFIYDSFGFESKDDLERDKLITKLLDKKHPSPSNIIANLTDNNITFGSNHNLEAFVKSILLFDDSDNVKKFEKVLNIGDTFYDNDYLNRAEICYKQLLPFSLKYLSKYECLIIVERLAIISYEQGDYYYSKLYYNKLVEYLDVDFSDTNMEENECIRVAKVLNNLGCALYKMKDYELALSCFNNGAKLINYHPSSTVFCEILYNLSLISYAMDDFNNAFYYIDSAIDILESSSYSRIYKILESHFNILKAYLLIKYGLVQDAIKILTQCLQTLRKELVEEHIYIMEIHFVYALACFYVNDLDRAISCAIKAYAIAKKVKADRVAKAQISELIGESYYYCREYSKAKFYLRKTYKLNKSIQLFSNDVNNWIKQAIDECENFEKHDS